MEAPMDFVAAENGNLERIRQALEAGTDPDAKDGSGRSALHWAAKGGQAEVGMLLLKYGADINIQEGKSDNPFPSKDTPLHWAVFYGQGDFVKLLIQHHANLDISNNTGQTPLICAVCNEREEMVVILLDDATITVNTQDNDGNTALHWAALLGYPQIAKILIDHGADRTILNNAGRNPLEEATLYGNPNEEMLKLLHPDYHTAEEVKT